MKPRRRTRVARTDRFSKHTPSIEVEVVRISGRGEGVGEANVGPQNRSIRQPIFVAGTLPTERVVAKPIHSTGEGVTCQLSEIVISSTERREPPCDHFGTCGGCSLQHWDDAPYGEWKRNRVIDAVCRAGGSPSVVSQLFTALPGTRRRAEFAIRALRTSTIVGFHERSSHRIINIAECPVLQATLVELVNGLRKLGPSLLSVGELGRATVNVLDNGLDLMLALPQEPKVDGLQAMAELADDLDLARVTTIQRNSTTPVLIIERRPPTIHFAGIAVRPPPGAFLQASATGEQAIARAVLDGLEGAAMLLDLHAGCGTLTFPMLRLGRVHAVDGNQECITTIQDAANRSGITERVSTELRDLVENPLKEHELSKFDAVVFDPPRAGARAQAERIATQGPNRVAAVSCNPSTFARDAGILIGGGYRLDQVTPIDQFLWSPHVELVAHFIRDRG